MFKLHGGANHDSSSAAPVQLPPFQKQIGIFPAYYAQQSETMVLKEKVMSLSGDSFDIKTIDGRPLFQIKGEVFSLSGRKNVMDMSGNHLFTIRKKHLKLLSTYYAEDPQGKEIFEVVSKLSSTFTCPFPHPQSCYIALVLTPRHHSRQVQGRGQVHFGLGQGGDTDDGGQLVRHACQHH
jgi:hypothetical protein